MFDQAEMLPGSAMESMETTGRRRMELFCAYPELAAAAHAKSVQFNDEVLAASAAHDQRSLLLRETEIACVSAAMQVVTAAGDRGDSSLRNCMVEALTSLRR